MTTPENGGIKLRGMNTKQPYTVNAYISDAAGAFITLNRNGAAASTSANFLISPPEPCYIEDMSFATGCTVMTNIIVQVNDSNRDIVPYANTINTLANRQIPNTLIPASSKLAFLQA